MSLRLMPNRPKARQAILSACILFALVPVGCGKQPNLDGPVPVKTKTLAPESVNVSSRFSGSIEPLQSTSLAFKLAGTVERLHQPANLNRYVQVGDTLAKGTVIAELNEGDLRRAVASAEARLAQLEARIVTAKENLKIAQRNFERYAESAGSISQAARDDADTRKVVAQGELSTAEHALADVRVQLDQARDDYLNRQLIVPFDHATVSEKKLEPGERVQAGATVFRLIDISTVHITFGVPDTMVGKPAVAALDEEHIELGQDLTITADAFEGRSFQGKVTKIAPQADPKTRTFTIELTLDNPLDQHGQPLFRPGMIVTVLVGSQKDRSVILLPMTAIHRGERQGEFGVYEVVAEAGRNVARRRKVNLGGIYSNGVEIVSEGSDIKTGSRIILTTIDRINDGVAVDVLPGPIISSQGYAE